MVELAGSNMEPPEKKKNTTAHKGADLSEFMCFSSKCVRPKVKNGKWCSFHKRAFDAMHFQAKANDPSEEATLMAAMSTAESSAVAFGEWEAINPDDVKFKRENLLDWVQFKKKVGERKAVTNRDACQLMEEREYMIWGTEKKGWFQSECQDEWNRTLSDKDVEKDPFGMKGRQRCWVDKKQVRLRDHTRFTEGTVEQGSKAQRTPTNRDVCILESHLPKVSCSETSIVTTPFEHLFESNAEFELTYGNEF